MEELSGLAWSALCMTGVACTSSIVLLIQRRFYHTKKLSLFDQDSLSLKFDHIRDYKVPFADDTRLTRVFFGTTVMIFISSFDLYSAVKHFGNDNKSIYITLSASLILITWLYVISLAFMSRRYKLPNSWGFVINIHLFIIFMSSLFISIYRLWSVFRLRYSNVSLAQGLPLVLSIVFSLDLVYTTGSIPQGPPFLEGNESCDEELLAPVASITVASIFSYLYFSWATPIIDTVYNNARDVFLPSLPPLYRSYNIFYMFGAQRGKSLIHRLIHANQSIIVLQIALTAVAAGLYYAPAYFLNKLLNLIQEIDEGKQGELYFAEGLIVVSGLSLSLIVLNVVVGQLNYLGSSTLRVRIKSMLNIEIYRKTLRRLDTVEMARDSAAEKETKSTPKTASATVLVDDVGNSSTGTIVNLMSTDSQRISDFTTSWYTIIEAPIELFVGISFLYSLLGSSCLLGLSVIIITLPLNHYNSIFFAKTQEKLMEARDKRVSLMNEVLQGIRQIKFFAWENNWEKRVMESREAEIKQLKKTFISEVLFNFLWQGTPLLVTIVSFYSFTKIQGQTLTAPIAFTAITVFTELRSALNSLPETFVDVLQALISVRRIESYLKEEEISPPTTNLNPNCCVHIGFRNATVSWVNLAQDEEENDRRVDSEQSTASSVHNNSQSELLSSNFPESPTAATIVGISEVQSTFEEADTFLLHNLNAHFPNGKLSIICGATGSGKTLMMMGLLGEAVLLEGESFCPRAPVSDRIELDIDYSESTDMLEENWVLSHAVAYVSQTAWLQNASIKDNILFGLPYVSKRYRDTLYACCLDKDMETLDDGDLTEIGEKGITLSGGQRARVALARAVYSRAGNVLMDDVLSAVDAHTAKHLYDKCLSGPLMEDRTRILITHHIGLCISQTSYLIHIENGRINLCGSPQELEADGTLETILNDVIGQTEGEDMIEEEIEETDREPTIAGSTTEVIKKTMAKTPRTLVQEEGRAVGAIKTRLYTMYLKTAGSPIYWLIVFTFVFGSRGLDVTESWWIKKWVHSNEENSVVNATVYAVSALTKQAQYAYLYTFNSAPASPLEISDLSNVKGFGTLLARANKDNTNDQLNMYLSIYILITMSNIIVGAFRFATLYYGTVRASKKMYRTLLRRVLRAPMRFFDTTPVGRILNRFSKDFEFIDSGVPNDLMYFLIQWLIILSSIVTVCFVLPAFIIPMTIVTFINILIGKRYNAASRELRRMNSVSRSPLFSHFGETLVGIATIRAYGATKQFMNEMLRRVDENARPFYYVWVLNRWVGVRFSFLGAAVNFCTGVFILLSLDYMDSSLAGFCLSFLLSYTTQMTMAIKRYTRLEMSFNAIERVVEFMEIEQEAPAITSLRPPIEWPTMGAIEVKCLEVRYAPELEPVLKGLTFSVKPAEKIGIVGRTGSGKSTLALSFFRFVEPSEGQILIDGLDIGFIGTEDLRSNLTIIPQDPVLFSGSLRSNLDPFDEFHDDSIFAALQRVELILPDDDTYLTTNSPSVRTHSCEDLNMNVFTDLETPVSEGGSNFSQGQRQLICLARALLKRNKIVFMDEATASVDFETDEAIQKTIASEFADCTILCIAHRLRTVIEYDRILVLDNGEIAEFASPLELLNTPDSIFNKMCESSGEYDTLVQLAKEKHQLIDVS